MKILSAHFELSAVNLEGCPAGSVPEFAFIGRSNVGKSTLLNLVAGKNGLARVSRSPGRTREINFFMMNDQWRLVDLPGYGYAKVSKSRRAGFNEFVSSYLLERENLLCAFVLVDSRHSPQKLDLEFVQWLVEASVPFVLVFTKADKNKPAAVRENVASFLTKMEDFSEGSPTIFTTSAKTREGRREILAFIGNVLQG
ncbi:MAG: YihA family ribosome biogenesis GTP-binding protein [Verrucomicrobiaceae bacterium]|nr:YihA family ribosome biogenesis GTP-binding protein [Verrucomicrobiaceae bacterium]